MIKRSDVVQWRTIDGVSIQTPGGTVTPEARLLVVRLPFGGIAWQRPVAIRVVRDGKTERIAIQDATRRAQFRIVAAAIVLLLVALVIFPVRRNRRE